MTTIVWHRDGILAGDKLSVTDGIKSSCQKIIQNKTHIIGICGDLSCGISFARWLEIFPSTNECPLNEESTALVMDKTTGECHYWDSEGVEIPIYEDFTSIGTGAGIALGFLEACKTDLDTNKTVIKALECASKYDINTGFGYDFYDIDTGWDGNVSYEST